MIQIRKNVPLAPYTTWKIGGQAEFLIEPRTEDEILEAYTFVKQLNIPITIIGRGSNILVDDGGIPGASFLLRDNYAKIKLSPDKTHILASAGVSLPQLSGFAYKSKLAGFEFLIGIPGTVGGGITCNAGKGGQSGESLKDILVGVTVLETTTGIIKKVPISQLNMTYRETSIRQKKFLVVSAIFKGVPVENNKSIILKQREIISGRKKKFPLQRFTAGSVFKTPKDGKPAGWYIDQVGLKGKKVGGVMVSHKHANWIENTGNGTAADVIRLIQLIERTVFNKFKVILEKEIILLPEK